MFKTSTYNVKRSRILVFVTAIFVLSLITNICAFADDLIYISRPNVPLFTCKTNGEWVNTQNGKYSNKLGSSIIWRKYIEETGTYSIDFSNEVLGVKYEILQNAKSWQVGYGNFKSLPGYYNLKQGTFISVILTVASPNPIEISTISFTKLSEKPPIPTPTPWGFGRGGTYDASDLKSNNDKLVHNTEYDCITDLKDGDEIILNDVKPYGAEKIANPIDTIVICAAVDDENEGATISGFGNIVLKSTGGKAPKFLEQVFTGKLESFSDGLVTLKIKGGTNICDIKWIKLFNSAYPDEMNCNKIHEAPEPGPEMIGDLSGDSIINSIDFAYMRQYLLALRTDLPVENDMFVADLDGDLRITAIDMALQRSWLLGMSK